MYGASHSCCFQGSQAAGNVDNDGDGLIDDRQRGRSVCV